MALAFAKNKTRPKAGVCLSTAPAHEASVRIKLSQQGQHSLGHLIGLGQDRSTCLLQNLRPGHVGDLNRIVCILNAAACSREVIDGVVQVGNGGLKTVLDSTQVTAQAVYLVTCRINLGEQLILIGESGNDVDTGDTTVIFDYSGAGDWLA